MFHPQILTKNQFNILKNLELPEKYGFYLAGGTALALQIGHRTSIDFDFYSQKKFDSSLIAKIIKDQFPQAKIISKAEDTLKAEIKKTQMSIFYYRYPLISQLKKFQRINIASIPDITAMKVAALIQRGTKRDFIDIYFILKQYTLDKTISFAQKKYPGYQTILIMKSLIYFEDAENEKYPRQIKVLDPDFSWEEAKDKIFAEVKKYQLSIIKKR